MFNSVCMSALLSSMSFTAASPSLTRDDDGHDDDCGDCDGVQVFLFTFSIELFIMRQEDSGNLQ